MLNFSDENMLNLSDEKRKILSIWTHHCPGCCGQEGYVVGFVRAGCRNVTEINAYRDEGGLGHIVWFNVLYDDGSFTRVNSLYVTTVNYEKE